MFRRCSNFCDLTRYLTIYSIFVGFSNWKQTREIAEVKNSSKTSEILWPHCSQESQFCCCEFQSDQSSFLVKSPNYQASVKTYRPKCQELKIDPLKTHHKKKESCKKCLRNSDKLPFLLIRLHTPSGNLRVKVPTQNGMISFLKDHHHFLKMWFANHMFSRKSQILREFKQSDFSEENTI